MKVFIATTDSIIKTNKIEFTLDRNKYRLVNFSTIGIDTLRVFYTTQGFFASGKPSSVDYADSCANLILDICEDVIEFDIDSTAMFDYIDGD